jgi:hypothetical protein
MLSLFSLCEGSAILLQSGENRTTFDYLGGTGSELKLTDFQE